MALNGEDPGPNSTARIGCPEVLVEVRGGVVAGAGLAVGQREQPGVGARGITRSHLDVCSGGRRFFLEITEACQARVWNRINFWIYAMYLEITEACQARVWHRMTCFALGEGSRLEQWLDLVARLS